MNNNCLQINFKLIFIVLLPRGEIKSFFKFLYLRNSLRLPSPKHTHVTSSTTTTTSSSRKRKCNDDEVNCKLLSPLIYSCC